VQKALGATLQTSWRTRRLRASSADAKPVSRQRATPFSRRHRRTIVRLPEGKWRHLSARISATINSGFDEPGPNLVRRYQAPSCGPWCRAVTVQALNLLDAAEYASSATTPQATCTGSRGGETRRRGPRGTSAIRA